MLPLVAVAIMEMAGEQVIIQGVRTAIVETVASSTEIALLTAKVYNYAFKRNTYFYTMKIGNKTKGFGVTKNLNQRMATHKRNCLKAGTECKVIKTKLYTKERAYEIERNMKKRGDIINTGIIGFKTEAVPLTWYERLIK